MGWTSGVEIFDPVCGEIVQQVSRSWMSQQAGTTVLEVLVSVLQDSEWDTEDESFEAFQKHEFVKAAFRARGVSPRCGADHNDRACVLEMGHRDEMRHQDDHGDRWGDDDD